jgi:hypothetical protein
VTTPRHRDSPHYRATAGQIAEDQLLDVLDARGRLGPRATCEQIAADIDLAADIVARKLFELGEPDQRRPKKWGRGPESCG